MTSLRRVWGLETFRKQLSEFAALDPAQRDELFRIAAGEDEAVPAQPLERDQTRLLPVAQTLAGIKRLEGVAELRDDLAALERAADLELVDPLGDFLSETPEDVARDAVSAGERSMLPTMEHLELALDLRASVYPDPDSPVRFVPVAVVRIGLDEPIGGTSALVFQLTDDGVRGLEEQLGKLRELRARSLRALPAELLPTPLQREREKLDVHSDE